LLWAEIRASAFERLQCILFTANFGAAKITDFNLSIGAKENIVGLNISVENVVLRRNREELYGLVHG
jgi:hypothetical protein